MPGGQVGDDRGTRAAAPPLRQKPQIRDLKRPQPRAQRFTTRAGHQIGDTQRCLTGDGYRAGDHR